MIRKQNITSVSVENNVWEAVKSVFKINGWRTFLILDCLLFQYTLTHGTKLAEIDFMVFLTIFEYAESNAERCQAQLFMQRLEFRDLKLAPKIAQKSLKKKGVSQYKAYVCLLYMWPTVWGVPKSILKCF